MENKYKILIVSNLYPPNFVGGAELIAHFFAKELQKLGHNILVFAGDFLLKTKKYQTIQEEFDGIKIVKVKIDSFDFDPKGTNFYNKEIDTIFISLLKLFKPDIVHIHNPIGLSLNIIPIAKKFNTKVVMTLHDYWGVCYKNTLLDQKDNICSNFHQCEQCMSFVYDNQYGEIPIIYRKHYVKMILSFIDFFVSPSKYLAEIYIKSGLIPYEKVANIWNGIQVERFSKVYKNKIFDPSLLKFTFIGYLGFHKGINFLLETINCLIKEKYRFVLNIVGDGELKDFCLDYIKNNKMTDNVKIWGKVANSEIEKVYENTDVLILPSIWPENHPVCITEAFASGIPVIASNLGGIPEIVKDYHNGILFSNKNKEALIRALLFFLKNKDSILLYGKRAFKSIERNSFYEIIKQYLSIYSCKSLNQIPKKVVLIDKGIKLDEISLIIKEFEEFGFIFVPAWWLSNIEFLDKNQVLKLFSHYLLFGNYQYSWKNIFDLKDIFLDLNDILDNKEF